jgi:hypothetical protein
MIIKNEGWKPPVERDTLAGRGGAFLKQVHRDA